MNTPEATSNAQTGSKFLAQAILAANEGLYAKPEDLQRIKLEVEQALESAYGHFEAMFELLTHPTP